MKGSQGKKKRSKWAFLLKTKHKKNNLQQTYLLNKKKKWEKRGWVWIENE